VKGESIRVYNSGVGLWFQKEARPRSKRGRAPPATAKAGKGADRGLVCGRRPSKFKTD